MNDYKYEWQKGYDEGYRTALKALAMYSVECAETCKELKDRCFESEGKGDSKVSCIGALAYFMQREAMYRNEIPGLIKQFMEEYIKTNKEQEKIVWHK